MPEADYHAAIQYALARLENELSPGLLYHSLKHTRDDVLVAVRLLAERSGVSGEDLKLLEVAAVFHDIGFLYYVNEHERRSADLAWEVLPGYGFSPQQVASIEGLIMTTRLPQSPHSLLEEILADADLDVLGREDFLERNALLRQEIARQGKTFSDEGWYSAQLKFMESHSYFTEAARQMRGDRKQKNIDLLRQKLETSVPSTPAATSN